jgi:hypothetical protein
MRLLQHLANILLKLNSSKQLKAPESLSALLARRKNVILLGYILTLHNLFLAMGLAIMFLGCLQAIVVEVERSSWLWGGPNHNID